MPQPALASIVIAAMLHLQTKLLVASAGSKPLVVYYHCHCDRGRVDAGRAAGIALGVALSLVALIYVTSHPKAAELGQLPGTEAYRDVKRHPEAATFPELLIWRIGGDLFFASIGHMSLDLKASLAARPDVKRVLLDCNSVNFIDVSAGDELLGLIKALQKTGIAVAFVRVRNSVRDDMRRAEIEAAVGQSQLLRTDNGWSACLAETKLVRGLD